MVSTDSPDVLPCDRKYLGAILVSVLSGRGAHQETTLDALHSASGQGSIEFAAVSGMPLFAFMEAASGLRLMGKEGAS